VAKPQEREPPDGVRYSLEEALELLAALEDGRDVLVDTDHLSVLAQVEHQIQQLNRRLGLDQGGPDVD
jgi:transcription initiation factor IIE alpha subunit